MLIKRAVLLRRSCNQKQDIFDSINPKFGTREALLHKKRYDLLQVWFNKITVAQNTNSFSSSYKDIYNIQCAQQQIWAIKQIWDDGNTQCNTWEVEIIPWFAVQLGHFYHDPGPNNTSCTCQILLKDALNYIMCFVMSHFRLHFLETF